MSHIKEARRNLVLYLYKVGGFSSERFKKEKVELHAGEATYTDC